MSPVELLQSLSENYFTTIVSASPRKFREEVFRRANIKAKGGGAFSLTSTKKNEVRIKRLFKEIQGGHQLNEDIAEELVRNYLYTRRPLLAQALDFFEVPHDDGLTDAELDFLDDLAPEKAQTLKSELLAKHDEADVDLYLKFMNIAA